MRIHGSDSALDLAELLVEKERVDEKIRKLELNQKLRNERKQNKPA